MSHRVSAVLAGLTAVLAAAAAIAGYARAELVDPDAFGKRVASALEDEDVRAVVGDRVVDGLAANVSPEVLVVRPLLSGAVGAVARAPAFQRLFANVVSKAHASLTSGQSRFVLDLDIGEQSVVRDAIRGVSPRAADAIPSSVELKVVELRPRNFVVRAARTSRRLADWWWPLLIATLLSGAACAVLAGGARRAITLLGAAAAVAGLLVAALVAALGLFVVSTAASAAGLDEESDRGAVAALWDSLLGDLATSGLLLALAAVVVAALASGGLTTERLRSGAGEARRLARSQAPAARVGRAAILVALGVGLLLEPGLTLRILLAAAGVVLILVGVAEFAGRTPRDVPREAAAGTRTALAVTAAVGVVLALGVVAVALVLPPPPLASIESERPRAGCNGSRDLCDRRLNEVVFPATHNSYAAADEPGWFFASQRHGIARQLRDGIRAFLIDIHLGAPDPQSRVIRTDLVAEGSSRNKARQELSPEALRTAERLAGKAGVGRPVGEPRPYLCHTLCEIGSEPLDEQFELFRRFLASNPNEVVILFIEPYVPVGDIESSLSRTGLLEQAAELRRDQPLPTLAQLIRDDTRLVVFAEQDGGARPWYLDGFSFTQDTPLGATEPSQLRCRRYRGDPDSPLYLVNHWIPPFPPSVGQNERIGGHFLRRRLNRCERRRNLVPNMVAVDFYERSGVVEVADALNARGG